MSIINCPECGVPVSEKAESCPNCGHPIRSDITPVPGTTKHFRGFEWRTRTELFGWPVIHIAFGRNKQTGKWMVAKGLIAVGQFGVGLITFAQFGIGVLFGFGQCIAGYTAIAQFALAVYFGLGQFATGYIAIGQLAYGKYVLAQLGHGDFLWTPKIKDPEAVLFFTEFWERIKILSGF
ncbi:zinc ribbon domain-containing protein [bacterium]|nr:zinc ribbon domain-containing protein [candidate division CSSED10-310 bacterium]